MRLKILNFDKQNRFKQTARTDWKFRASSFKNNCLAKIFLLQDKSGLSGGEGGEGLFDPKQDSSQPHGKCVR